MQTRLFRMIRQLFLNSKYQFALFQNVFTASLFFLFIGFVTGSSFCTILGLIRDSNVWDGLIIIFMLFFFERVGKQVYNRVDSSKTQRLLKFIHCWKTGILFGFFALAQISPHAKNVSEGRVAGKFTYDVIL